MRFDEGFPKSDLLIARYHASSLETSYVNGIVIPEIRQYYRGDIRLAGGRSLSDGPWWVSRKKLFESFKKTQPDISQSLQVEILHILNNTVRMNDLSICDFAYLPQLLQTDMPSAVNRFLQGEFGPPGSDIDIRLEIPERRLPSGVRESYFDSISQQTVEIWY